MKISAIASSVHHWIRPHVITRSKMEKLSLADVISGKSGRDTTSSKTVGKLKEMFNMRSGIPYKSGSTLRYTPLELGASHRDVGSHERRIPLNFMRIEIKQAFSALKETDLGYAAKATLLSNLHMFEKQLNSAETCWKDHLAANADRSDPNQVKAAQLAREWLSGSQVGTLTAEAPVDQALNPSLAHAHAYSVSTPKDSGAGELRRTPIAGSGEDTGVDPNVHSQQDELDRYLAERVAKYEGLTSHEDTTRVATLPP